MNAGFRVLVAAAAAAAALTMGACHHQQMAHDEENCKAVKAGTITTVNTVCAVVPEDPVDPAVPAAEWKGQKIGFCCAGCTKNWAKMTDAQKDAAVAKAIAMSKK